MPNLKSRNDEAAGLTGISKSLVAQKKKARRKLRKPPAPRSIIGLQRTYIRDLIDIVGVAGDLIVSALRPVLPTVIETAMPRKKDSRNDGWADDVRLAMNSARLQFLRRYTPEELRGISNKQAGRVDRFNAAEFDRQYATVVGIAIPRSETWLNERIQGFVTENVSLITTLEESHFGKVEQLILRNVQGGSVGSDITAAVQDLIDQVEDVEGSTEARAALIARDQTSKFNGALNQARQVDVGVNKYIWSTSLDERVRDSHAEKEGEIFSWDDPPADTGHPGQDIQCRCVALPYFDETQVEE